MVVLSTLLILWCVLVVVIIQGHRVVPIDTNGAFRVPALSQRIRGAATHLITDRTVETIAAGGVTDWVLIAPIVIIVAVCGPTGRVVVVWWLVRVIELTGGISQVAFLFEELRECGPLGA